MNTTPFAFKKFLSQALTALVIVMLLLTAVSIVPVFAVGETPPPATEEPLATEEPVVRGPVITAEPVVTEEPVAVQEPVMTEEPVGIQEPIVTEAPTELPAPEESGQPEAPAATEPPVEQAMSEAVAAEESVSITQALEQLPADTQVVILAEDGSPEPLVTQEAQEILQNADPMWCPEGLTPGSAGCTASYTSLQALLDYLDANEPSQAGVIWIAGDYDSSVNDPASSGFILDGATAFPIMSQYDLTVQGGWSGGNNAAVDHGNLSIFNGDYLSIQNWTGNVTINDIQSAMTNAGGTSVTVSTVGNVIVTNSNFTNDCCGDDVGLEITSTNGSVTLNGVTTDMNHWGTMIIAHGDISILNSTFRRNGGGAVYSTAFGIISKSGGITLNGVTTYGTDFGGQLWAVGDINIMNSNITHHLLNGMSASSSHGNIFIDHSAFNNNGSRGGAYLETKGNAIVRCSEFKRNGEILRHTNVDYYGYGLNASSGSLTLSSVTFEGNVVPPAGFPPGVPHDYLYDGTPTIDMVDCTPVPGSSSTSLAAAVASSSKNQILYYRVAQNEDQLPSSLGEGNLFVSALKVILTPAGEKISHLSIVLSFLIPEGLQDDELTVVHWNGSEWELVPGESVVGNYFVITVNSPGVYVLVSK